MVSITLNFVKQIRVRDSRILRLEKHCKNTQNHGVGFVPLCLAYSLLQFLGVYIFFVLLILYSEVIRITLSVKTLIAGFWEFKEFEVRTMNVPKSL